MVARINNDFIEPVKSTTKYTVAAECTYSSADDYAKLLKPLLRSGGRLLSKSSVSDLFKAVGES